jgi:YidC/Oxa1 family membrane protein insertase
MDRKGIAFIALCVAGMVGLKFVADWMWPTQPRPPGYTNSVASLSNGVAGSSNRLSAVTTLETPNGVRPVATAVTPSEAPAFRSAERTETLENEVLRLTLTSHGGGVRLVELKKYPASVNCLDKEDPNRGLVAALNRFAASPALTLGVGPLTGDGEFQLVKTPAGVRAEKLIPPGIAVVQDFALSNGYFLETTVTVENRSATAVRLPEHDYVVASATPMDRHDKAEVQGAYWFNGSKAEQINAAWFANMTAGCSSLASPRSEFAGGSNDVVWAAVHNQFFALIAQPGESPVGVRVRNIVLPKPSAAELIADAALNPAPHAFQTSFTYPGMVLEPGTKVARRHVVYAGPKEYRLLKDSDKQIDLVMDFTGITGFCAKALLLLLNGLHGFIPSYGWSIVVLTVLIKLAFWPLTNASTKSMKRMASLQPQLNEIKAKYKNDPQKANEKTMAFMKENRINPMAGCLPLLLTFPVFIGFFFMLRTSIELRGESFLWCCDLSQPDSLYVIPGLGFLPLIGSPGVGLPLNLMPVLYLGSAWWLSSLTPVSPQMDPAQQKLMRYMPVFFGFLFYNYSAGLTLYWTTQNLMSILQTKITKATESGAKVLPVLPVRRK